MRKKLIIFNQMIGIINILLLFIATSFFRELHRLLPTLMPLYEQKNSSEQIIQYLGTQPYFQFLFLIYVLGGIVYVVLAIVSLVLHVLVPKNSKVRGKAITTSVLMLWGIVFGFSPVLCVIYNIFVSINFFVTAYLFSEE